MRYSHSFPELAAVLGLIACGGSAGSSPRPAVPPIPDCVVVESCPQPPAQDPSLPPVGFGSLRQDQVGVNIATPALRIRVIPLDEKVIRLLSPDAYRSLHDMRESRSADIRAAARNSARGDSLALFMVTFFGMQPQSRFNPDDLLIVNQNATYRPIGRVAMTPRFNENLLDVREQAAAIYLYESGIDVMRPMTVQYGQSVSDAWSQSLTLLNAERSRVQSRASGRTQP